mgnify:CR=1 FL=1
MLDAWGVKGWFKVQAYSNQADALSSAKRWFLKAVAPKTGQRELKILSMREHGEGLVASADGVVDRNGAEALRGFEIWISRADFPRAGDGEYYWVDLIGLNVVNREGLMLGQVRDLMSTGPQTVLVIEAPAEAEGGKSVERMIPFVSAFVDGVDLPGKRITVDWQPDY